MPQGIKRALTIASTVLVVLIVLLAILLVGVRIFGYKPYTVLSGSMRPEYYPGSIIYVVDVDPNDLKVGDPVTFMLNKNTVATHRIIEVFPMTPSKTSTCNCTVHFTTKGDANKDDDGEGKLHASNVIGKPVFSIPIIGYIANFVQNPPGRYISLGICALMLVAVIFSESEKKTKQVTATEEDTPSDVPTTEPDVTNDAKPSESTSPQTDESENKTDTST